ncbi:hypothetical protein Tco_0736386 [Tanacetum coccineum]
MILESVENGTLIWPTVEENGVIRTKKYAKLSVVEKIQADCFVVPVFSPGDDLIAYLNKEMVFLTVVASSRFPSTNNELRTSSNPRNQSTIQDGRVTVQQVQERQGQSYSGNALSLSDQGMHHGIRKKAMLAEAQEDRQILDEEQLAFLADPGVPDGQAVQTIILNNAAFQT